MEIKQYHVCWFALMSENLKVWGDGFFDVNFSESGLNDLREHLANLMSGGDEGREVNTSQITIISISKI